MSLPMEGALQGFPGISKKALHFCEVTETCLEAQAPPESASVVGVQPLGSKHLTSPPKVMCYIPLAEKGSSQNPRSNFWAHK